MVKYQTMENTLDKQQEFACVTILKKLNNIVAQTVSLSVDLDSKKITYKNYLNKMNSLEAEINKQFELLDKFEFPGEGWQKIEKHFLATLQSAQAIVLPFTKNNEKNTSKQAALTIVYNTLKSYYSNLNLLQQNLEQILEKASD
jgi:hypothetical protein